MTKASKIFAVVNSTLESKQGIDTDRQSRLFRFRKAGYNDKTTRKAIFFPCQMTAQNV
jgi:hypothetical protein